ncbi:YdiU family protein [Aliidiomarina iranensis]|uniref:Protein nucleotidyltransferase YdiU n=1 Tax=Aliidiomarina iranensis TaxID=1434071 RepID=A0A432W376_9GAMM|nr:YdiU family protein [Aliidiomarina iranensis]RUO23654.1 YdiU family protein [Aliidiomarina iranensis]
MHKQPTHRQDSTAVTEGWETEHSLRALGDFFYRDAEPTAVRNPQWIAFNQSLAEQLNIPEKIRDTDEGLFIWAGNHTPDWAKPAALAYSGHQFAHLNPQLGDGRALLLAEVRSADGKLFDLQLKGAGRTPFSRGGDGRSAIGPVMREYLLSESMQALGVPTTRALAAVASGEMVFREDAVPGAIFTRVASSHIRVGSFQFALLHGGEDKVKALADYTIARHFSHLAKIDDSKTRYLGLLTQVAERQAELVNQWLRIGFIHGVMNTDNTSICGETIDYGPAAFLDSYNPNKVFSSIDRRGRYAFNQQIEIAKWNLARFAETLLPLITGDTAGETDKAEAIELATRVLDDYSEYANELWLTTMGAKLGIQHVTKADLALINQFLALLHQYNIDYTQAFWQLANELNCTQSANSGPESPTSSLFLNASAAANSDFQLWRQSWLERLISNDTSAEQMQTNMQQVNPAIIPRNHRIAEAILAVEENGDLTQFNALLNAWQHPYEMPRSESELALYQGPAKGEEVTRTFCGT